MKLYDISGEQFSAMDAPRHLMTEEGTAQTTLDRSLGICQVAELEGKVTREVLEEVMEEDCERLLIRGDAQITRDGADYLAEKKLVLLGVEQETVGNETSGNDVHQQLLKKGTVIVENLNLEKVNLWSLFSRGLRRSKRNTNTAPDPCGSDRKLGNALCESENAM